MSDRYRPPAGPKGQRNAPPGPKGNWKGSGSKPYYNGPLPKRYKERDNYRPNLIEKQRGNEADAELTLERPSGPSGYRDGPSKRLYPDNRSYDGPNKRRDFDTRERRDPRDSRDSRDARDTRDSRDSRDSRDTRSYATDSTDSRHSWEARDARDSRSTRDIRALRDYNDSRSYRDSKDSRDPRDSRDSRDPRDSRDSRDSRDPRESRDLRDSRDSRDQRDPRGPRDSRDQRDQRDSRHPRNPRDSGNARNVPEKSVPGGSKVDVLDRAPRGPKPIDRKIKEKKQPVKSKPPRLEPSQLYLVYCMRSSELYQRVQQVGEGTYGKVYKAKNELTGEHVALKKLRLESEREGFPITAIREIKLLQNFDHPNIVGLLEMSVEHNQIYMIFDYLDHDLTGLLTHPDLNLTEGHRKTIFKQLMEGLSYLHSRRVIHRDIKGSNILLDSKGVLKIADFGLARTMKVLAEGDKPDYTNRVITIWYRPPELLLGSTDYGREVDIWGVGCLLIELYTKSATFQGTEEISQLQSIFEIMGTPTIENWPDIENMPWFEMLKPRVNIKSRFQSDFEPLMSKDGFDLALKLLELVPSKRLTAEQALQHPYFTADPKPEPLTFMETLEGEWHEFETKKRRREERKRLQSLKNPKNRESSVPPTQPRAPHSTETTSHSLSETPFDATDKLDAVIAAGEEESGDKSQTNGSTSVETRPNASSADVTLDSIPTASTAAARTDATAASNTETSNSADELGKNNAPGANGGNSEISEIREKVTGGNNHDGPDEEMAPQPDV